VVADSAVVVEDRAGEAEGGRREAGLMTEEIR